MILGVVLAGGLARRMGGGDKGLKTIGGVPLFTRVIDRIGPQVDRLVINANGDAERLIDYELPIVPDDVPDYPGPLAGILAAMDYAAEMTPCDLVLSVAADCPFLPVDLCPRLLTVMQLNLARVSVAHSGGHAQPTIALWDVALRQDLRRAVEQEGLRKIDAFTARYKTAEAEWPATPVDPFFNANAPEDLALAETLLARYPEA